MEVSETQRTVVRQVLQQSKEIRMRAIQQKISLAFTFCTTVELDVQFDDVWRAKDLLKKLASVVNGLTAHINDPAHVPDKAIRQEFRTQLAELRQRVMRLHSQIEQRQLHYRRNW